MGQCGDDPMWMELWLSPFASPWLCSDVVIAPLPFEDPSDRFQMQFVISNTDADLQGVGRPSLPVGLARSMQCRQLVGSIRFWLSTAARLASAGQRQTPIAMTFRHCSWPSGRSCFIADLKAKDWTVYLTSQRPCFAAVKMVMICICCE